jgi:hypothetical protein
MCTIQDIAKMVEQNEDTFYSHLTTNIASDSLPITNNICLKSSMILFDDLLITGSFIVSLKNVTDISIRIDTTTFEPTFFYIFKNIKLWYIDYSYIKLLSGIITDNTIYETQNSPRKKCRY